MTLVCFLERWAAASDPLYVFLSFALAVIFTATILAVQLLIGLSARYDHGSQQHQTFSKGANR
jgi:hypothetical protein